MYDHELVDRHAYKVLLVYKDAESTPIAQIRFDVTDTNWGKEKDLWVRAIESINEVLKADNVNA